MKTLLQRFIEKIYERHRTLLFPIISCVCWKAASDKDGYGWMKISGKKVRAHKVAWELSGLSVPPGKELHHTCYNRACVNVNHLELVPATRWHGRKGKRQGIPLAK